MIRDDKERVIGKIISINSDKFTVELLNQSINFTVNGYDNIYLYAQINGYVILPYQDFYIVAEIFGVRERDADSKWKSEKEQVLSKSNSIKYLDILPIGTLERSNKILKFKYGVSIFPTLYSDVLYIRKAELDAVFEVNVDEEKIEIEINKIKGTRLHFLDIGTSSIFPEYKVKLNINSFFGAHSAVLGNTGSGKSCTISSMIQTLCKKEGFSAVGASFIFYDVNGEYHRAFSQIKNSNIEIKYYSLNETKKKDDFCKFYQLDDQVLANNIEYCQFELPHWFLTIEEWALLLSASEKTQLPILRFSLGMALIKNDAQINHILATAILYVVSFQENSASKGARMYTLLSTYGKGGLNTNLLTKHCFNSQFGSFQGQANTNTANINQENFIKEVSSFLIEDFQIPTYVPGHTEFPFDKLESFLDLAILYEEAHGNKQIRDFCSSLITRYKSIKSRDEFNFLIKNKVKITQENLINSILGKADKKTKNTQISIIDLSNVDDEVVEVLSCVTTRIIFEFLKKNEDRNQFPVNVILEEAHRYISNEKGKIFGDANKIFERIAKEGRKYGMFLMVSSQRPSELSRTVLSQCSNFIVHRIQNPEDLSQIRQMTPHISGSILSRLPSIPKQHALVFGHSVQIPTLFKVNQANPTPHSQDNDITANWFKPKEEKSNDEEENIYPLEDLPF